MRNEEPRSFFGNEQKLVYQLASECFEQRQHDIVRAIVYLYQRMEQEAQEERFLALSDLEPKLRDQVICEVLFNEWLNSDKPESYTPDQKAYLKLINRVMEWHSQDIITSIIYIYRHSKIIYPDELAAMNRLSVAEKNDIICERLLPF